MLDHLVVFLVALGTTVAATPPVRALARRLGAVDQPEERRVHAAPTPTMGGLALLAGVLAAIGAGALLPGFDEVFATTSEPEAVVLAAVVIAGVGAVDDLVGVSAPVKLAGQLLAAGMLVLFGVSMLFVWIPGNPGSIVSLTPDLGALFTIAAIVAMINAVNLVDGLDGLAAGIVAIASVALFCYVEFSGHSTVSLTTSASLLLAALAGACVGFLFYNFNPASIFMGDTGAMLLGLLLGAAGVSAVGGTVSPGRGDFAALSVPVLVPVLVLAVPFFDTAWAVLRRLASRRAVFAADKQHLHHRLVDIGHSHRRAVLIMYLWSALVAFAAAGIGILTSPLAQRAIVAGVALVVVVAVAVRLRTLTGRPRGRVSRGRGRARAG